MLPVCFQEVALAENKAAYAREALERRRLHNVVQELRGNIRWAHLISAQINECAVYICYTCACGLNTHASKFV